jgi:predicted glutamine amidotransferase
MQLLGIFANDADNLPSLMYALKNSVGCKLSHPDGDVWSVGYFDQDRALIIRKPGELIDSREFYELAPEVKSQVLIGFVQDGSTGPPHAPPHRFRNWLFGGVGQMDALESMRDKIEDRIPGFIKSELAFERASELAFAMFLRELHERNLLDNALASSQDLALALDNTAKAIRMLSEESGLAAPSGGIVASNGRCLLINAQACQLHWKRQEGLDALPEGPPDPNLTNFKLIVEGLKRFRAIVVAAEVQSDSTEWRVIESGQTAWVDRQLELCSL